MINHEGFTKPGGFITWLSTIFLQLTLLSIIMVGQSQTDAQVEETKEHTMRLSREVRTSHEDVKRVTEEVERWRAAAARTDELRQEVERLRTEREHPTRRRRKETDNG